ncbi:MAG: hypothetical protein KAS04_02485, partial [Candidatus Aenigmarchaeota archaeon]|nr:hypothetical protein [Candidatus Aenigmarchaeota archaeon]
FAELLGLDQTWESGEGTIETEREELFPNEEECRHTSKKIKLLAEEPDKGISGGEKVCTWTYIAPSVKTGLKVHATPRVRFFYKYSSSTIKTITIVPREELKTLQNQGKGLPSESYSKTRSPIDIGIETSSPVRSYGDSVEFPIIITVKNTGGGTVCKTIENCKKATWGIKPDTDINEGWYVVNLDIIIPPDSTIKNCNEMEKVVLIGTTPQTFSCKMTVNIRPDQIGLIQKKIEVRADYGYFIDKSSSVTVLSSNQP